RGDLVAGDALPDRAVELEAERQAREPAVRDTRRGQRLRQALRRAQDEPGEQSEPAAARATRPFHVHPSGGRVPATLPVSETVSLRPSGAKLLSGPARAPRRRRR